MSKQKHDLGNKKRRTAEAASEPTRHTSPEALAQNLVRQGLASRLILDSRIPANREPQP